VCVVGLLLLCAVVGCSASRSDDGGVDGVDVEVPEGAQSVVVIGDSLTEGAAPMIEDALAVAGYENLAVDGASGRRTTVSVDGGPNSGVEAVASARSSGLDPDVWVIALGTNDVPQYADGEDYAAIVTELLASLPDGAAMVWVDVYLRDHATGTGEFNNVLHLLLDSNPASVVAGWNERATADGMITDDGVHPTAEGQVVFADTIVDGLAAVAD
jgi:lysophospholipase L1-like esterase